MPQLEPEWPAEKMKMARDLDQGAKRDAIEGGRVAASQGVQVNAMAVGRGHHGEAREAAFRRFRLSNDGQMTACRKTEEAHPTYIRTPRSGLVSQLMRERFSRMISALKSMSGWSGTFLPVASMSARSRAAVIR